MSYTPDSTQKRCFSLSPDSGISSDEADVSNTKGVIISPKSDASSYLGDIVISPDHIGDVVPSGPTSSKLRSQIEPVIQNNRSKANSGLTFGRELLNSPKAGRGSFNFQNILNDPNNVLYQCHAPPGPLGIVVDTTPLGPRVKSLNPLSPLFGSIKPGDIIVGIDEIDTVGMEAGNFWKTTAQRANQQERVLTMLII